MLGNGEDVRHQKPSFAFGEPARADQPGVGWTSSLKAFGDGMVDTLVLEYIFFFKMSFLLFVLLSPKQSALDNFAPNFTLKF